MIDATLPSTPAMIGRGIGAMILAAALYSVSDALIKWLASAYPTAEIVFWRQIFALLPIIPALWRGGWTAIRTNRPFGQIGRALTGAGALLGFYYCYRTMPLADVFGISFAAPLFVTALSVPILGEHVGWRRWSAVGIGFAGVLLMVQPGTGLFGPATWIALLATLLYALSLVFIRDLSRTESTISIVFFATLTIGCISGAMMPFQWVTPRGSDMILLGVAGILGGMGQLAAAHAFRLAPAAVVAPFDYSALLYTALIGYAVWGDLPAPLFLCGALIVIASGLYIFHRETRPASYI